MIASRQLKTPLLFSQVIDLSLQRTINHQISCLLSFELKFYELILCLDIVSSKILQFYLIREFSTNKFGVKK